MAFEPDKWADGPDGGTPITAAELNRIEAAGVSASAAPTWASVTGKPTTFAPATHTHAAADITSGTLAVARIPDITVAKVSTLAATIADFEARIAALEALQA